MSINELVSAAGMAAHTATQRNRQSASPET